MDSKRVNAILLGAVLPVVLYALGAQMGYPLAGAAIASLWGAGVFAFHLYRKRRVDAFSALSGAYVFAELLGLLVTRDPDWFLVAPIVSDGIMSAVFLLSMLLKKPLIQVLAEQSAGPDAFSEELRSSGAYGRVWMHLSLMWGAAYAVKSVLKLAAFNTLSTDAYLAVRTGLGWPVVLVLIGFSFWYPRWCWRDGR